jgi:hypothetical protein
MSLAQGHLMRHFIALWALALAALAALAASAGSAQADVLLDETNLIGLPGVAAPSKFSFTASSTQALTLTLKDLQIPAAFGALQVVVTLGDTLVGSAAADATTHTATVSIPAAAGNYTLYVVGTPDAAQGIGSFGACVAPAATPASCIAAYSFSGNIQAPATASSTGSSTLNTNFTSTTAGTYTVTVTDDAFPAALQSVAGGITQGASPISAVGEGTTQVTLLADTNYQLLLAAIADSTVSAGLYGVKITDPASKSVFARTLPVGTLGASAVVDNGAAQALNLSVADYDYPAPLAHLGVAVTQDSTLLAKLTATGSLNNFMAAAGSLEVWRYTVAGAQPGVYGVSLSANPASGAVSLFAATQVVNPTASTTDAYAFVVDFKSAGTYNLAANDFEFPSILASLTATIAQNGTVLPESSTGDFTAAAGVAIVLVDARAPQSGNGIFGVTVETAGASPQILLDETQAVGGVFTTQSINLGVSGGYTTTLADLGFASGNGFPPMFQNLAVVVSQGSQVLGKIYGGGSFSFPATPGQYVLTFVATPDSVQGYGLYTVNVSSTPPTLTFTSSAATVAAGQAATLTWSSQNATTCTASGGTGWSGVQSTSGSVAVSISGTETLALSCAGPGGSVSKSLSVTASAPPAKSGGGGSLDAAFLSMLGAWVILSRARPSRARSARATPLNRSANGG